MFSKADVLLSTFFILTGLKKIPFRVGMLDWGWGWVAGVPGSPASLIHLRRGPTGGSHPGCLPPQLRRDDMTVASRAPQERR